jgi:hypothetical protein
MHKQFSLISLILLTTLVCVCLGLVRLVPSLGIILLLVAPLAYMQTVVAVYRIKNSEAVPVRRKLFEFAKAVALDLYMLFWLLLTSGISAYWIWLVLRVMSLNTGRSLPPITMVLAVIAGGVSLGISSTVTLWLRQQDRLGCLFGVMLMAGAWLSVTIATVVLSMLI